MKRLIKKSNDLDDKILETFKTMVGRSGLHYFQQAGISEEQMVTAMNNGLLDQMISIPNRRGYLQSIIYDLLLHGLKMNQTQIKAIFRNFEELQPLWMSYINSFGLKPVDTSRVDRSTIKLVTENLENPIIQTTSLPITGGGTGGKRYAYKQAVKKLYELGYSLQELREFAFEIKDENLQSDIMMTINQLNYLE